VTRARRTKQETDQAASSSWYRNGFVVCETSQRAHVVIIRSSHKPVCRRHKESRKEKRRGEEDLLKATLRELKISVHTILRGSFRRLSALALISFMGVLPHASYRIAGFGGAEECILFWACHCLDSGFVCQTVHRAGRIPSLNTS